MASDSFTKRSRKNKKKEEEEERKKKQEEEARKKQREKSKKANDKNPPAKTKIGPLSKEKADDDATRTRTFIEHKRKRPAANLLTNDRAAKTIANIRTDGSEAKSFIGDDLVPEDAKSRRERLDEKKKDAKTLKRARGLRRFVKRTREKDKKKSEEEKRKAGNK